MMSTACMMAKDQKPVGAPLATKWDRMFSTMVRMARSAMPLS
jgi:hypothetical protein